MIPESAGFTHEDMKRIVADPRYHCGQCDGILNVAWGGAHGVESYVLRCSKNIEHNRFSRRQISEKERAALATLRGEGYMEAGSSTALMAMSESTMIERVDKAKFIKDLSPAEKKRLALVCITYGFDPIMGEMTIYEGNPYVSVDGRYRKAQETGLLMGVESRPATKDERAMWEISTEDKFFRAVVKKLVGGQTAEFVGWGRVTAGEIQRANQYIPVSTNPMRMAEKRAEVQALRKAFSIPLPAGTLSVENIVEGSFEIVDEETGEIKQLTAPVENKVKEPAKKKAPAKATAKPEEPPAAEAEASDKGDFTPEKLVTEEEPPPGPPLATAKMKKDIEAQFARTGLARGDIGTEFITKRGWALRYWDKMTVDESEGILEWLKEQPDKK